MSELYHRRECHRFTPEDVLQLLNVYAQLLWPLGDSEQPTFTFETTLNEWGDFLEEDEGLEFVEALSLLETLFELTIRKDEVLEWFTGGDEPTLRTLCEFVAERAEKPHVEPVQIGGTNSLEAGLFLAIKSTMHRLSIDTSELRPSAAVKPWLEQRSNQFLLALLRLSLGSLPAMQQVQHPLSRAGKAMCLREFICLLLAAGVALTCGAADVLLTSLAGVAFAIASVIVGERLSPTHLQFVEDLTFRDLCEQMAHARGAKV